MKEGIADEDYTRTGEGGGGGGGDEKRSMIGIARLVTDYTTFGYLTDVYVLAGYQGKGLGKWLMQCLDEELAAWPELRRCVLFTKGEAAIKMYGDTIGAREVASTTTGLVLMERKGKGAVY
jgi:GNAT superfamily N-acetyltransferase